MEDGDVPLVSPNDVTGQMQAAVSAMRGGGASSTDTINTRHILFVVSGAFSGIDALIRRRLMATERAAKVGRLSLDAILAQAGTADLMAYGLEPEFVGRLPVRVACHGLDTTDLFNVLRKSESSLIHQYRRSFAAYGIRLEFRDDGLQRLAELASSENTGARGLMTICERVFRDFKFRLPSSRVKRLVITREAVDKPQAVLARSLHRS
jgi:ATP-dependent protease Clp ATPase subunit